MLAFGCSFVFNPIAHTYGKVVCEYYLLGSRLIRKNQPWKKLSESTFGFLKSLLVRKTSWVDLLRCFESDLWSSNAGGMNYVVQHFLTVWIRWSKFPLVKKVKGKNKTLLMLRNVLIFYKFKWNELSPHFLLSCSLFITGSHSKCGWALQVP